MTGAAPLVRWRVQRIDEPAEGLIAVSLRAPGGAKTCLILSVAGPVEWGLVDERPRGRPASAFALRLRKHLRNALIEGAQVDASGVTVDARRGERRARLELRSEGALVLTVDTGERAERRGEPIAAGPSTFEAMRASGPRLVERVMGGRETARRRALEKALGRRIAKLERRLIKIAADEERAARANELRAHGSAILSQLAQLPARATEVEVTDWTVDPPTLIRVPIRPGRTPREEAEALFARARKLERGAVIARERAATTTAEIAELTRMRPTIASADPEQLGLLEEAAARRGVRPAAPPGSRAAAPRLPFHVFRGTGDRPIHVGRSARDNDALTLGAKPWDLWLHARGVAGSHVVVPLSRSESCPPELLIDAAHLAAHYSTLRDEPLVEITYVERRYVRKPRGYAVGAVRVEREKVVVLRLEPERLTRLLASGKPA